MVQLRAVGDGRVDDALLDKGVEVGKIVHNIRAVPRRNDLALLRVQCDDLGGQVEPLRNAVAEGIDADGQNFVPLAVAVGVVLTERPQHGGELVQVLRLAQTQTVGPVAAVQHAEKAVHVGVVQIVFVLHVAEPVDVAVLGGGGGAQIRVGFVKSLARGAGGVFVNDIVQRQDQPLFGQRKQQRIVQRVHLYNIGQLLAGGQQCAQCVGVLRGVDDLPGDIQVRLVEPAVQNLKCAVFSDFVPVITGRPPFGAHDSQVTFLPG